MLDVPQAAALRRDNWIVITALLAISALALGYTWWLANGFDMRCGAAGLAAHSPPCSSTGVCSS